MQSKGFLVLLTVLVLLLGAVAVTAQEVTAEPDPVATVTAVVTLSPGTETLEVVIPQPANDATGGILSVILGAIVGAASVLAGLLGIVGRLRNDKAALDAIEWLGKSIPETALEKFNELGRSLGEAGEVLEMVTDGLPNEPQTSDLGRLIRDTDPASLKALLEEHGYLVSKKPTEQPQMFLE